MTCINCKYQWCWLCEGEYKYGHYDSGRCKDQWFAIADYPKEINNDNNNLDNNRDNRNGETCCFGLHRIFRSLYPDGYINVSCFGDDKDNLVKKYIFILLFWFFGIFIIFFAIYFDNVFINIENESCSKLFVNYIAFFTGLVLFVSFQIFFTCLASPFILICFIYHKFFDIFLKLFGFEL